MKLFEECRYCGRRYVGCHTDCYTYIRDRKRLDEIIAKQRLDNDYIEYYALILRKRKR